MKVSQKNLNALRQFQMYDNVLLTSEESEECGYISNILMNTHDEIVFEVTVPVYSIIVGESITIKRKVHPYSKSCEMTRLS